MYDPEQVELTLFLGGTTHKTTTTTPETTPEKILSLIESNPYMAQITNMEKINCKFCSTISQEVGSPLLKCKMNVQTQWPHFLNAVKEVLKKENRTVIPNGNCPFYGDQYKCPFYEEK